MKKTLLFLSFILCQLLAFAQAPQGLNYQAIYRDDKGVAVANQTIAVVFSILENSIIGTSIYIEKHTAQTNAFGLFNLVIGKGAPQTGTFANIDWSNGSKFLKVEVNNTLIGTTQLLSAPYALYAENGSQKLSIAGKTISLSKNGDSVTIPKDSTKVRISKQGDSLWIDNTYVIIKGVSAANGGGQEADAGQDLFPCTWQSNTFEVQLGANFPLNGAVGKWEIIVGDNGELDNSFHPNTTFRGKGGEMYILKWTIVQNGIKNEDFVKIKSPLYLSNYQYVPFAGFDTLIINSNKTVLSGSLSNQADEKGKWTIESGKGGVLGDISSPNSTFEGIAGETYLLKWNVVYYPYTSCQFENFDFVKIIFSNNKLSNKGNYYIPDLRFRRILQVLYPMSMVGDSLKINEVSKITKLNLSTYGITNFDGLQYLAALKYLNCSGQYSNNNTFNDNESIIIPDPLPNNLDTLICKDSRLNKLPKLPINLKYLDCSNNPFSLLAELPNSLEYLDCSADWTASLKRFPKLPDNLKYLYARGFRLLTELPLLPISLKEIDISSYSNDTFGLKDIPNLPNTLKKINLSGRRGIKKIPNLPNSLEIINFSYTSIKTLPILPTSVIELNLGGTQITVLPQLTNQLKKLDIWGLKIEKLPYLPSSLVELSFPNYNESKIICITNIPPNLSSDWTKQQLALYPICP